ncbi:MAG: hypothetical protein RL005_1187 [Planctomycetota bacterium]
MPRSREPAVLRGRRSLWGAGMPRSREPAVLRGRRSLWGAGMPRSRETALLVRPSLPLGRRHASFAQTVLACSETGASVRSWSLTAAARQLSSQAAELALRGMPRPLFRDGRNGIHECHAVTTQRRAVRSDRAALRCAALGVAKAAHTACSEAGSGPAERRTRARAKPGGASASAQPRARGSGRTSAERSLAISWPSRPGASPWAGRTSSASRGRTVRPTSAR